MSAVVIQDEVKVQILGGIAVDLFEEGKELLVPVPSLACTDDGSVQHVKRGEQGRRAVAPVVMGHRAAPAPLYG